MALEKQIQEPGREPILKAYHKLPNYRWYDLRDDGGVSIYLITYFSKAKRIADEKALIGRVNLHLGPDHTLSKLLQGSSAVPNDTASLKVLAYEAAKLEPDFLGALDV